MVPKSQISTVNSGAKVNKRKYNSPEATGASSGPRGSAALPNLSQGGISQLDTQTTAEDVGPQQTGQPDQSQASGTQVDQAATGGRSLEDFSALATPTGSTADNIRGNRFLQELPSSAGPGSVGLSTNGPGQKPAPIANGVSSAAPEVSPGSLANGASDGGSLQPTGGARPTSGAESADISTQNSGASAQNKGASVQNTGASAQNTGASGRSTGAAQITGASAQSSGNPQETNAASSNAALANSGTPTTYPPLTKTGEFPAAGPTKDNECKGVADQKNDLYNKNNGNSNGMSLYCGFY